jgi:hypothetical protein
VWWRPGHNAAKTKQFQTRFVELLHLILHIHIHTPFYSSFSSLTTYLSPSLKNYKVQRIILYIILCSILPNRVLQSSNQDMGSVTMNPLFRTESFGYYNFPDQNYTMIEKRQLFLRSYQFCRKKSLTERIKGSFVRAKKVVWLKLRYARGLRRKLVFFPRFKCGFYYRRRRFSQLLNSSSSHHRKVDSSSCLW